MIFLVDYGLGNIQAFVNIYKRLNIDVNIAKNSEQLSKAERIILPGVGAFDWAMTKLNQSGMRECLDDLVAIKKKPVLGVCVGMQIMAKKSEEGEMSGLGWVDAEVKRFDDSKFHQQTHLPHMGWNEVSPLSDKCIFDGIESPQFYFLHSYYFAPNNMNDALATTEYGDTFISAIRSENIFGTQFHPEKSHHWGIRLLKNFAEYDI